MAVKCGNCQCGMSMWMGRYVLLSFIVCLLLLFLCFCGGRVVVSVVFFPLLNIQEFCCVKAGENSVQRLFPVFFTHKFHGQGGSYILSSMVLIYGMA